MSHAVAAQPRPLPQFLRRDDYASTGEDLRGIFTEALKSRCHYYAPVTITHTSEALASTFHILVDRWFSATRFQSSLTAITSHPAYTAIIALGDDVVPLILGELEQRPAHWFSALRTITGSDPVQSHEYGNVDAMSKAWLQWAKEKGISWSSIP